MFAHWWQVTAPQLDPLPTSAASAASPVTDSTPTPTAWTASDDSSPRPWPPPVFIPSIISNSSFPNPPGLRIVNHISTATHKQNAKPTPVIGPTNELRKSGFLSVYHVTNPARKLKIDQSRITNGPPRKTQIFPARLHVPFEAKQQHGSEHRGDDGGGGGGDEESFGETLQGGRGGVEFLEL
ncbi:unnamed protein product [Zymoseptoria tritici ST99CH_1E4]|uniref:Uncharacterized protein n=1 Tax=Zymoseptoria tritici ST99CH_1E4 TaxID=1276532 RepID=A0A2H1H0R0_ZYMTR|nr:unnamed protein product [Zymoseptoria tritici ST99CH_1E4]